MTNAQTWTAMIGLLSLLAAVLAFSYNLMSRTLIAEMRTGFAELRGDIRVITHRLDGLDTGVQAITRRLMDGPDSA